MKKIIKNKRQWFGFLLLIIMLIVPFLTPFQIYLSIPNDLLTSEQKVQLPLPSSTINVSANGDILDQDDSHLTLPNKENNELIYDIAGFPIKKVDVSLLDDLKVVPGGQSIGVQLQTLGVLVVGHYLVQEKNNVSSPGEDADIHVGDIILKINGETIRQMEDVKPHIDTAGETEEPLKLEIKRGEETFERTLQPIYDTKDHEFQIGLYIRDSAAGIGTMSFYEPDSKKYGALGHVISDMDTKKPIEINEGKIVRSSITSIAKGNQGTPGEKQAKFSIKDNKIGEITKNSPFGIFGHLVTDIKNNHYDEPMSVALSHEVKEGEAQILTVVEGERVEEFDIEIVSSVPQKFPATKGMVIKITDPKLLEKTGGIVQGMSGSPIIQDNKIVGAVTHVFVNDPTSGYGVHIEWMLEEAGINIYEKEENKAS